MRVFCEQRIDPNLKGMYQDGRLDTQVFSHSLLGSVAEIRFLSGATDHTRNRTSAISKTECDISLLKLIAFAVIAPFQWIIGCFWPSHSIFNKVVKTCVVDIKVVGTSPGKLNIETTNPKPIGSDWEVISAMG